MITNPEDTGIFNPKIAEFVQVVHDAGGLCAYDQANANGILGITRAKEAGFDLCHFNLHKTFSTPHGCGGPGGGVVGATVGPWLSALEAAWRAVSLQAEDPPARLVFLAELTAARPR